MASHNTMRIVKELRDFERNPEAQFQLSYNEDDLTVMHALITGPPETPYAYGLFNFKLVFPTGYPIEPPKADLTTTNQNRTRFNPNLYAGGKVCLSILGTWRGEPGEMWNHAHGIQSVLISIQSLMGENPFTNEPGFDKIKPEHAGLAVLYKRKIAHETIRVTICDVIEKGFTGDNFDVAFQDTSKYLFMCYYQNYLQTIKTEMPLVTKGKRFERMPFEGSGNTMDGSFDYEDLTTRLNAIKDRINAETEAWVAASQSSEWLDPDLLIFHNLMGQFRQITASGTFDDSMELQLAKENSPYVWTATLFGKPETNYEGGFFQVRLVFHKDFPKHRARIQFITPFYHPEVSSTGYFFYHSVPRMDDVTSHLQILLRLLTEPPRGNPTGHCNPDAAKLHFGTPEQKREYARNVRRCASRSVE
ncbi:ubiquitin-conjugating enzyme [Blastocladiella britannica]|nr:ubiquitin-conjugating enzyme [Blastocladiella britannica]